MTPDDITAEWLSSALGSTVDAVECEAIGVGVGLLGDLVRARITTSDTSLPASVIVKLPTHHEANRAIGLGLMLYERELRYLVRAEWAETASDILERRTKHGLHLDAEAASAVADWLRREQAESIARRV